MRGEYRGYRFNPKYLWGSPPLARGIHSIQDIIDIQLGITPACAGNTGGCISLSGQHWDHPRLRGEYQYDNIIKHFSKGSPPLARGIRINNEIKASIMGITPACAGNTRMGSGWQTSARDHPRLRGEYTEQMALAICREGSPPLARGIRNVYGKTMWETGITPACAGNTVEPFIKCRPVRDHPRLRGEYPAYTHPGKKRAGSPPLARGILRTRPRFCSRPGITPACAGNTSGLALGYLGS